MGNANSRVKIDLPPVPGAVAALRYAMEQGRARQSAMQFIKEMDKKFAEHGVDQEARDDISASARTLLLDCVGPEEMWFYSDSCLSDELICPDEEDAHAIDKLYGLGFTDMLCRSVPAGYPKRPGEVWPGDVEVHLGIGSKWGGIPMKYLGHGESVPASREEIREAVAKGQIPAEYARGDAA